MKNEIIVNIIIGLIAVIVGLLFFIYLQNNKLKEDNKIEYLKIKHISEKTDMITGTMPLDVKYETKVLSLNGVSYVVPINGGNVAIGYNTGDFNLNDIHRIDIRCNKETEHLIKSFSNHEDILDKYYNTCNIWFGVEE